MKKREEEVLLTPNLYLEISSDINNEIATLKQKQIDVLKRLKEEILELKKLEDQRDDIMEKIYITGASISGLKNNRFKLMIELAKQKRIARKLNREMSKDESYIRVGNYYTTNETNKKR